MFQEYDKHLLRNQTTFSGFVDVYNVDKQKIFDRDLYMMRFEEGRFTWKLKTWFYKLNYYSPTVVDEVSAFNVHNLEKLIEVYYSNFESAFLSHWKQFHDVNCSSKNEEVCRQMCKTVLFLMCLKKQMLT